MNLLSLERRLERALNTLWGLFPGVKLLRRLHGEVQNRGLWNGDHCATYRTRGDGFMCAGVPPAGRGTRDGGVCTYCDLNWRIETFAWVDLRRWRFRWRMRGRRLLRALPLWRSSRPGPNVPHKLTPTSPLDKHVQSELERITR